ncbi:MAG: triple tyrosine motif-containing protein [Bacteroidota bacterium]
MRYLLTTLFISITALSKAQNTIGLPEINNFQKIQYKAGLQNWDFRQDQRGVMYIANNEGMLSYDGSSWTLHPLPNKTIARSLEIVSEDTIYVGGQGELGFFSPDRSGTLIYTSLLGKIPIKDRSFGDVWDIVAHKSGIFFRCSNKIFELRNSIIKLYTPSSEWAFLGAAQNKLFAQDFEEGLLTFEKGQWVPLDSNAILSKTDPITGIITTGKDSFLITTLKNGIYELSNNQVRPQASPSKTFFIQNRIYAATLINGSTIALATSNDGVYIIDKTGSIIQHFSKKEGLQQTNVLSVFCDQQQNLWLGLDNGIDFIAYNSAIKQISPSQEGGPGYGIALLNNQLFVGTSTGLYQAPLKVASDLSYVLSNFKKIESSEGQIWNLTVIDNRLFAGHHEGGFVVANGKANYFNRIAGNWNFVPFAVNGKSKLAVGNYQGIAFIEQTGNSFTSKTAIPNFEESSRYMVADNQGNLWVSHPYHGVYRVSNKETAPTIIKYEKEKGIPTPLNNHIFKLGQEIVLATEKGILQYNQQTDNFIPHQLFSSTIGSKGVRYIKEDKEGNYWFVQDKSVGVINIKAQTITYLPELSNKILSGFENIFPINNENIFISAERGIFHVNYKKYLENKRDLKVQIRKVNITGQNDSLLFGGFGSLAAKNSYTEKLIIPNKWKTIRFGFSAILYGQESKLEYSYRLKGFDKNWSAWSTRADKEYSNLLEGRYTFEVKTRNNLGSESSVTTFEFTVLPPWFRTSWAYAIYIFLFAGLLLLMYQFQKIKFSKQQKRMEEENKRLLYISELELNKTQSEVVALQNEKLESEINFKNSELASSTMHLVKKGELLSKIKEELAHVLKHIQDKTAIQEIKKVIKSVSDDDKIDQEWETFAKHFDKVHSDFVVLLKKTYPSLTANEVKLCIYLRMNLSSKEIAQLMNISVRGVEISRYRLRKKIGIPSEVNLFDHLMQIDSNKNEANEQGASANTPVHL